MGNGKTRRRKIAALVFLLACMTAVILPAQDDEFHLSWNAAPERTITVNPVIVLGYLLVVFTVLGVFFIFRGNADDLRRTGRGAPEKQGLTPELPPRANGKRKRAKRK